jgi:hypothetical protein
MLYVASDRLSNCQVRNIGSGPEAACEERICAKARNSELLQSGHCAALTRHLDSGQRAEGSVQFV